MNSSDNNNQKANQWMKYSGLAFQFLALIGVGVWIGQWLDTKMANKTPICTIGLSILMLCGAMYKMIKDVMAEK
jgi:ATP synthase protein I